MFTVIILFPILYIAYHAGGAEFLSKVFSGTIDTTLMLMFGMPVIAIILCLLGRLAEKMAQK